MNTEQAEALRKPFSKAQIGKLPKGGMQLDYVGHAVVTDRLLEVDPEWTYRVTPPWPGFESVAGVFIELTVGGVTRPGFGEATGGFSPGDKVKAAVSDAIRNAAMRFGVALDLWSKEELESDDHPQPARAARPAEREGHTSAPADSTTASARPASSGKFASAKSLEYLESLVVKAGFKSTAEFIASGDAARLVGHVVRDQPNAEDCSALIDKLKGAVPATQVSKTADPDDPWSTGDKIMAAPDQLARLNSAYVAIGIGSSPAEKKMRLSLAADVIGHDIATATELTRSECSAVITAIENMKQGETNA